MYVDGVLVNENLSAYTWDTTYPFIGGYLGHTAHSFAGGFTMDGLLDDVRIYDRALSQTEIEQLYTMTEEATGGDCADTTIYRHPLHAEVCDDIDNDCDGSIDEGTKIDRYADVDEDGFSDGTTIELCADVDHELVVHYTFDDGTASDVSGNGNDGTDHGV